MFQKLSRTFSNLDYNQGRAQISYGDVITYYDAELAGGGVFFTIPLRYRGDFCLSVMKINSNVPPHTDSEIKTTINFYVEPNGYTTTFYTPKPDAKTFQIPNQTNGVIYNKEDVDACGSFKAEAGDAWLLDVTKAHGVEGAGERTAVCLATDKYDYNQVLEMLKETNNVL